MIRVKVKVLMIAWVSAVPALCMGGVIVHACDCPTDACDDSANESARMPEQKDGCGHESACSNDPCAIWRAGRAESTTHLEMDFFLAPIPVGDPDLEAGGLAPAPRALIAETPSMTHLPYPPSDLPLLI